MRLRASQTLLDRVLPRQQPGVSVTVVIGEPANEAQAFSPSEVIRKRLRGLRELTRALPAEEGAVEYDGSEDRPWDGESVEGELLDAAPLDHTAGDLDDDWP